MARFEKTIAGRVSERDKSDLSQLAQILASSESALIRHLIRNFLNQHKSLLKPGITETSFSSGLNLIKHEKTI